MPIFIKFSQFFSLFYTIAEKSLLRKEHLFKF
jgi:hypothetical protein